MAGKIKGITIEIGGNTQKLNKALEDVNKKTRDVQSELKQVERLLKLDPKNTELLAQKQKLLAEAVENSREKLDRLKTAQEQVNEQFRRGEINEEQYRAFQREVVKAEQELEKFEKQLRDTGITAEKVGQKLKDAGKKMTDIGKDLSMKVTAPLVAAGAASFKMAADLQDAMGATEQIFKGAADSVKTWADNLDSYYGIAEAEALEYANMMGSMLVNIGGLTEEQAAKQAQTLIELAGDLTAMYGGTTADAVRALTGALKGNNTMLDNYGMAVNDAMIKTKALEMGLYDGTGQMDLATKQAATLALIMEQTGAAQGQAAREAEGASGGMRALATEIKNLSTDIGEVLLPVITPFIQKLKDIVGAFGELSPDAQKAIIAIAGIAAAIGPLLVIIGTLVSSIGAIVGALGGIAIGPILAVVAAIAALVAGVVALWKNNEQFREGVIGVWEKIKQIALPIIEMFKNTISNAVEAIKPAWESLKAAFQDLLPVLEVVGAAIGAVLAVVLGVVVGVVNGIINALAPLIEAFSGLISFIVNVVNAIIALFRGDFAGAWEYVKKAGEGIVKFFQGLVEAIFGFVKGLVEGVVNFFKNLYDTLIGHSLIPDLINGIIKWFSELPGKIWEQLVAALGRVREWGNNLISWARSTLPGVISNIVSFFRELPGNLLEIGKDIVEGLWNGIKSLGSWLKEKVESFIEENIPDAVAKLLKIKSPSQVMIEFGRYVAEGLAQGMEEGTSEVAKKAQQMAQAISNAVQKMTGELSNALNLSNARLELQKELLGDNAEEAEKLALELKKLNSEKDYLIKKIDILSAAYETSKEKLGENNETTKQYAYELEKAQIELQKMEVSIRKTSVAIEEQKKKAIEAARRQAQELRNLADEVTNVEKKYREDLAAAAEEYQKKVQEVNNKLIEDERRVTEEYEKAVEARAKSLRDFVGLFDAVTKKEISGQQLLENLRGQVAAFEDWQKNIQELAAKGVDEGLIAELQEMGPKAGPEIAALNTLTDEQLKEYVALWKRKNEEARAEAINQLQQQRIEMQQKLMEIRQAANEQLELYRAEWEKKNAEIRKNAEEELKRIQQKFNETAEAGTKYGMHLILNFAQGMESQFYRLRQAVEEARAIAAELDPTMRHSPSLVDKVRSGLAEILAAYQDLARKIQNINLGSVSMPALAGASGSVVYTYNNDNRVINITVQDGEDLLRTLHRLGVRIP